MSSANVVPIRPALVPLIDSTNRLIPRGDQSGDRSLNNSTLALLDHVPSAHRWLVSEAVAELAPSLTPEQRIGLAIVLDEIHEALGPV